MDLTNLFNQSNFEQLEENIWVLHNFLTPEETNHYIKFAESQNEESWWNQDEGWWNGKYINLPQEDKIPYLISERVKSIIAGKDKDYWMFGIPGTVNRQKPGESMPMHYDAPGKSMDDTSWVGLSFVMYHSNFNGGEICYPDFNIEYKPNPGDLVIHRGLKEYVHGTNPVLPGPNRYNSTMWAYDTRDIPEDYQKKFT